MKKKIAILLTFLFSFISVLTGCNLFDTSTNAALSSIVATSGDISITRKSLIDGYNNGGYQYNQYYGYSLEDSFKRTIDELVDQEYLFAYIDSLTDERYILSSDDYRFVVSGCWDYVSSALSVYVDAVRRDFKLSASEVEATEESEKPEFAPQERYQTKFFDDFGRAVLIYKGEEDDLKVNASVVLTTEEQALDYAVNEFNFKKYIRGSSSDYKNLVWKRYITALKSSQKYYNYSDMSDGAVFEREVTRLFEANLKSRKLSKFQNVYESGNGYDFDATYLNEDGTRGAYIVSEARLDKVVEKYKELYIRNLATYYNSQSKFYGDLTGTTSRENYVFYGSKSEETLITCVHILIKLSSEQISEINALKSGSGISTEATQTLLEYYRSAENTFAKERDLETGEEIIVNGEQIKISVQDLYDSLANDLRNKNKLSDIVETFNNYLYRYNEDGGIINAKYDYVVGSTKSAMVESFTDAVRELYNNGAGKVGSISQPIYEENDNYSGFHIVLYTGTLDNLFASDADLNNLTTTTVFDKLSKEKTSVSYNQTLFEKLFEMVAEDNFSAYRKNIISTLKNGVQTTYQTGNFKDLYQ